MARAAHPRDDALRMIRNVHSSPRSAARGSLVRADLLRATARALQDAESLEERARRHPTPETPTLLERLDAHREILARRAANVALGAVCTATRWAAVSRSSLSSSAVHTAPRATLAAHLVAVHGAVARRLGLTGRLS